MGKEPGEQFEIEEAICELPLMAASAKFVSEGF
jgi:hypothetical protein